MGRLVSTAGLLVLLCSAAGCGLGPRNFRKINHPAPLVRARAISLGYGQPNSVVLPPLISRLDDPDVVVRMAAHEELKRRSGKDFGYVPWGNPEERNLAVNRWNSWLTGRPIPAASQPGNPRKSMPRPSPQDRP
jgi:hypothetical protein